VPLVRIDVQEGRSRSELRRIADTVQDVMLAVFAAPPRDRYQVITEHPVGHIIAEDTGLGLEGRSSDQKQAVYAELARALQGCGVRPEDLIVSVTANERADWSFGLGRAQFLTGEL
jgi:phenylpyruvate tautomerase PptA (4-oxalocrotonate tautomerase family)